MINLPSKAWLAEHSDNIFDQLVAALDQTAWTPRRTAAGVTVLSGYPTFAARQSAVEGFLTQSEITDVTLEHGLHYFHDACHFLATASDAISHHQILEVWEDSLDHYRAIVRTAVKLPWPLKNREYLHWVGTKRQIDSHGRNTILIAYSSVSPEGFPTPWNGHLRCTLSPSGQRLTDLGHNRLKAEHCITSILGGSIPIWAQNSLFRNGHVNAYHEEWIKAMARLKEEATKPAAVKARVNS